MFGDSQFVGICRKIGIISQGPTAKQAIDATIEAIILAIEDDLERGFDVMDRTPFVGTIGFRIVKAKALTLTFDQTTKKLLHWSFRG